MISAKEREAIRETIYDGGYPWKDITEDEFLKVLSQQEEYFHPNGGFVGLSHLVKTILGDLGFDYRSSYGLVDHLEQQGRVEIYYVENETDHQQVAAIRSTNSVRTIAQAVLES